jgi:PAS domain S-box-containing protein
MPSGGAAWNSSRSWIGSLGLAAAVGVAYFLAARLSLHLLTEPDGVAVFWPAAGIASGTLIALGAGARLPVAAGVMAATILANLLGDRNLGGALVFALCNAGEAILVAWLIECYFGPGFRLDSSLNVLTLFGATTIATAISGVGGTVGFILFHGSGAPAFSTWQNWFAADALGVVTVAPLAIGLAHAIEDPPSRREVVEGLSALGVLTLASVIGFASPPNHWFTILFLALQFPLLLWPTAHCRPVFTAAGIFTLSLIIVWTITVGIGPLGDPSMRLAGRVHAVQAALLALSTCALVLAALFSERRHREAALNHSNDRLQLALDSAELGVWSVDPKTGRFENDARDRYIHGHDPNAPPRTLSEARLHIHPDDLPNLDAAFAASGRTGGSYRTEYRLQSHAARERWISVEGTVVRTADGRPVQLLGVTRDITERKHSEAKLQESERASRVLLGALPAAIYVTDTEGRITYCNAGAVDLWGATPKLGEDRWCDFARFYYADGAPMALEECPTEIALRQGWPVRGREAILERADGTRVPIIPYPTPLRDKDGTVVGVVNMTVDITERKKAERALEERNTQLALAGKAGLVGSYAYDVNTGRMQISEGYAAIHGLPEGTTETLRSQWLARVHLDDVEKVQDRRQQAFADQLREYSVEYRIVRSGGEVRWIESRGFVSYDDAGHPQRVIGVNIDATGRKQGEERQSLLAAELDHRVKNALASVRAVVSRTLDASRSMPDFVAALDGRIQSMARAHELLSSSRWQGMSLAELVRCELAPYATSNNLEIDGREAVLSADAGQALAMVLHELVTNAAKYGALSTPRGRVSVRWDQRANGKQTAPLVLEWQETGGPPVLAANRTGFGTSIVRELIPYELGGAVDFTLNGKGVSCRLEIPDDFVASVDRHD